MISDRSYLLIIFIHIYIMSKLYYDQNASKDEYNVIFTEDPIDILLGNRENTHYVLLDKKNDIETVNKLKKKYFSKYIFKQKYNYILNYIKIANNEIHILSNKDASYNDISKDSDDNLVIKVKFIKKHILPEKKFIKVSSKFISKYGIDALSIDHSKIIRNLFFSYITRCINAKINHINRKK